MRNRNYNTQFKRDENFLVIGNKTEDYINMRREILRDSVNLPLQREEPAWLNIKKEGEERISRIKREIKDLKEMMLKPLSLLDNISEHQKEIDQRCEELMAEFDKCFKLVRQLEVDEKDPKKKLSLEQVSLRSHICSKLCGILSDEISDFKQMQNNYAKVIEGPTVAGEEVEEEEEWMKMIPYDPETEKYEFEQELARLRGVEYMKIYASVRELKELFTSLSRLVVEQGTIMDRIEMHLVEAHRNMDEATEILKPIVLKSSRGLYCWIGLLVFVVIFSVAVIVIIKIRRG